MRYILLLLILCYCSSAIAFDIPDEHRVPNQNPGYCAWSSIETLGRFHKIRVLNNLVENRKKDQDDIMNGIIYPRNLGYSFAIRNKLKALKVKFLMQDLGQYNRDLLKYANTHGCVIAVKEGALGKSAHAIVITEYNNKEIRFYDSNKTKTMWIATRQWFDQNWTGLVVVVLP